MTTAEWAILFDLDQTLVLTEQIEYLRRKRAWQQVYRSFSKTLLPPGTREFIDSVRDIACLGVVTTSPRPYAENLLAYHKLDLPVVIAYHDTTRRKPHPESILKAAEKLQVLPQRSIYIGDLIEDIIAASRAGAFPIGLSWDRALKDQAAASMAYSICENWDEVYDAILNIVT